ncbi:COX15/CtaA family protein [Legionella oakridgensis]|uniref:Protein required for cytochrome oxidase assembly n=2 Tax=Legionella oakridgensis TaxID=29423 RepID=W0BGW8_9GAMM|nr:COX15/CtaA family protein [Legionella oakridgensis]AHE67956.1 protein required for cytochrome oxidase assembly [Legionella oakridgensis ATCC 33761 = DSM 21215]ETO92587.1 protein required for cytochrome oxidase assembly [Legionella oakridgensis RV-2-2007]KTD38772.1 cytochrome c oxidase assembly protein [Legionella oakridgensis]STY20956.1 cytochrome c oxidase assembly protein [Legionella longbeachae]
MKINMLRRITTLAIILALTVVMLGAYTRLTDAGLGCPDWPGCYGQMVLPSGKSELSFVQKQFPEQPFEKRKAWTEMVHRYAAGTLGLLILIIFLSCLFTRALKAVPKTVPLGLMCLVIFQAMLGMWTVTLKLLPVVVMAHLLGGILIFAGLCYFGWQLSDVKGQNLANWRFWIILGTIIVFLQIGLGGWVSSNYAGIACIGFPKCNGTWIPKLYFSQGFNLFLPVGANYQGGLLESHIRVTIQFIHRLGAVVTAGFVLFLSGFIIARVRSNYLRAVAMAAIILVLVQFLLGVMNVIYFLPLWVAVAHNGVAALLFVTLFSLLYLSKGGVADAPQA